MVGVGLDFHIAYFTTHQVVLVIVNGTSVCAVSRCVISVISIEYAFGAAIVAVVLHYTGIFFQFFCGVNTAGVFFFVCKVRQLLSRPHCNACPWGFPVECRLRRLGRCRGPLKHSTPDGVHKCREVHSVAGTLRHSLFLIYLKRLPPCWTNIRWGVI